MDLALERTLRCSPEKAFVALTVPEVMSRWSTAGVVADALGDGAHPAGVGALRRVHLPDRRRTRLHEVVVESEPPDRFVYAVVDSPPIRHHRGTITLEPVDGGCRVRWHVEAELPLPWLERAVGRRLEAELSKSLDRLVALAPSLAGAALPPCRVFDDALAPLYEAAEQCAETQRRLADALHEEGDARVWFTRVYQYVTEAQIAACRAGTYLHPHWVLRLIVAFHGLYAQSLDAAPEAHWTRAFGRMARVGGVAPSTFASASACILFGMQAHIEHDLPRAIAQTYVASYRGRCDPSRFRADYLRMSDIFRRASDRMLDHFEPSEMSLVDRLARRAPLELRDAFLAWRLYDIPRSRRLAFAQAESIIPLLR